MKSDKLDVWGDVAFCGLLIAGGVILLQDLSTLKHAVFDPLGSATVPRALIWLVIVLAAIVAGARLLGFNVGSAREVVGEPADGCTVARRLGQVGAITALVAAYVYTIAAFLVPFSISTMVLVAASTLTLTGWRQARLGWLAIMAVATGILGELLFTKVFHLPLPGF